MKTVAYELPCPPSINGAYANRKFGRGKGRFPSKRHREWKKEASWIIRATGIEKISGPYHFKIQISTGQRGDASNYIKLAEDLLVEMGVTDDDKRAMSSSSERYIGIQTGRCVVTVWEA